jgi:hypothetical protein
MEEKETTLEEELAKIPDINMSKKTVQTIATFFYYHGKLAAMKEINNQEHDDNGSHSLSGLCEIDPQ